MKALETIKNVIEQYSEDKADLTVEQVQELRDDLSTSLFLLADEYADSKMRAEAGEYSRRKAVAEQINILYGTLDDNGKKFTQKSAEGQAIINSNVAYSKEHTATRDYEYMRQIVNTANGVMNSMASRIHIMLREQT